MQRTRVESSAVTGIAYDATTQHLEVEFRNHTRYHYFGVSAELHAAFLDSPSKGQFFNRVIRGHFAYAQVARAGSPLS